MKITTIAALKKIPVGTKFKLVRQLIGDVPPELQDRELIEVQGKNLLMKRKDGKISYLGFYTGTKVSPIEQDGKYVGFQIFDRDDPSAMMAEYRFI